MIAEVSKVHPASVASQPVLYWNIASAQPRSLLMEAIQAERQSSFIDEDCIDAANAAAAQAKAVVQRENLGGHPRVMFSDDGILVLQWQKEAYGVALIFAGDGTVSVSRRGPGRLYSDNDLEMSVNESIPPDIRSAIARLA
jgi:hypothetical protein